MTKKRVTIEDVARTAGVSLMTVSRAVNGREGISEGTRIRILELARQLNYQPSQIARSLATRQTSTFGLVVPDVSNPFFSLIARGAEDAAFEFGYSVFLLNSAEDPVRERSALDSLWQKEVNGVILCSSRLPQADLSEYFDHFPQMVLVNRELTESASNIATINVNDRFGAEAAVRHLVQSGRQRIALIAGPLSSTSSQRRIQGFRDGLEIHSLSYDIAWIQNCPPTMQGGCDAALRLLDAHPDLDAFLAYNDLVAIGALQACKARWKSVPTEVAVIGVDDVPLSSVIQPALSTLRVNQIEIGRKAVSLLVDMISRHPDPISLAVTIQPELIIRESG